MTKKILFYYHHFGGLGHGVRIFSICKALKKYFPIYRLLVINSGTPQPELGIGNYAKIINLPVFKARKGLFSGLSSPLGVNSAFRCREGILKSVAEIFNPDLVLFEHYPFGRDSLASEIDGFINILKQKNILVYSSVRDIILRHNSFYKLKQRLGLFEGIFIHSDREMGFKTNFRCSVNFEKKFVFTGRVFPISKDELIGKKIIQTRLKSGNKKLIVISIGGGIDGFEIIENLIMAKNKIDKFKKTFYLISAGPSVPDSYYAELKNKLKSRNDIVLKKFIPQFASYVKASDLYVSMGGYNSINNILFTNARSIVFPRLKDKEQLERAKYFSKFINIGNLKSFSGVSSKIINILSKDREGIEFQGGFRGADITARLIERIFNLNYIKIRLTTRCNQNCDMCSVKHQRHELDFQKVIQIIDQAKILNVKTINFTGGEPSLYPYFLRAVKYAKKQGFSISVSTNGIMLKKYLVYLSKLVDYVDVPLHSHIEQIDDKIKGRNGAFSQTVDFIKTLVSYNKNIKLHINVTVRPDNYKNINKIAILLSKYIYSISFTLVDTSINKMGKLQFKKEQLFSFYLKEVPLIVKNCFENNNLRLRITPFFNKFQKMNNKEILKMILVNKKNYLANLNSIFVPDSSQLCARAKNDLRINADGQVCPCCYLDDYPVDLGNINNNTLSDIVTSDKYFNFIIAAKPKKGWCNKCLLGYKRYSHFF